MAMTRQEALNDALERLDGVAFTMEPGFSEHGPMVAETISTLGRHDRVAPWADAYKAHYRHIPAPPPQSPIDGASETAWRQALGVTARSTDWFDFFRRELRERPWQDAIRGWVPRLIDGYAGGLTHGLIRAAHAVRAMPEDGAASSAQLAELARGLAYWAGAYAVAPGHPDRHGDLSLAEAVQRLPRGPSAGPSVPAAIESLGPIADAGEAMSRHTATFARVLLAHPELPMVPQIQLVHTITSVAALRNLLPFFPPAFAAHAYRRAWHFSASTVARLARPSAAEAQPEIAEPALRQDELIDRAIAHGDDHVIKLTEACLREDRIKPDPVYRALAEAIPRRIPAWSL
jgi:Questin oxidase-like